MSTTLGADDWRNKYYPVRAIDLDSQIRALPLKQANLAAIDHAILKFEGLKPEVLRQHGLGLDGRRVEDRGRSVLAITSDTCALCCLHDVAQGSHKVAGCSTCPLPLARGGVACDDEIEDSDEDPLPSPYHAALDGDPEPMLGLLRDARTLVEAQP